MNDNVWNSCILNLILGEKKSPEGRVHVPKYNKIVENSVQNPKPLGKINMLYVLITFDVNPIYQTTFARHTALMDSRKY